MLAVLESFESGLSGWSYTSGVGITSSMSGFTPASGSYFAFVNGGCFTNSMSRSFSLSSGVTVLSFTYGFKCGDYAPYRDSVTVAVTENDNGALLGSASVSCADVGNYVRALQILQRGG